MALEKKVDRVVSTAVKRCLTQKRLILKEGKDADGILLHKEYPVQSCFYCLLLLLLRTR